MADAEGLEHVFHKHQPDAVMHLAAESHVDRSIDRPADFIETNILGTYALLEVSRRYYEQLPEKRRERFLFLHVSTDEVFGSLGADGTFGPDSPYDPRSPYAASKAAADHLVRAWHHTYGLPVVLSNCSNNFGPFQFPEKLIPLTIINGLTGRNIPVYGRGQNVRDWLFVEDHVTALLLILRKGRPGATYLVGGAAERRNIEVVRQVCELLDEMVPDSPFKPHGGLISFVEDRPGHDLRYAIDFDRTRDELGWEPEVTFEDGLRRTVGWYLDNRWWWEPILERYRGERFGLSHAARGRGKEV